MANQCPTCSVDISEGTSSQRETQTTKQAFIGSLFALPWCCIIPAIFSVLGLAGVAVAREVTEGILPYLLVISVLFLGRAHYLIYIKHQGNRLSHIITWAATFLAVTLWGVRWLG